MTALLTQVDAVTLDYGTNAGVPWYMSTPFWLTVFWTLAPILGVLLFVRFVPMLRRASLLGLARFMARPAEIIAVRAAAKAAGVPTAVLLVSQSAFDAAMKTARPDDADPLASLRHRVFG